MGANLPEFKSCFGLFSLKTGVYIIAVAGMIFTGASIIANFFLFFEFVEKRRVLFSSESELFQKFNGTEITDERLRELMSWTNAGFGYYAIWIFIKCIIFFTAVLLFYGVCKNEVKMFKIYLYINVPYWVVNCIIALIATYFFAAIFNLLAVGGLLIDCCRLLIIRSAYREMTGKRRFLERSEISNYQQFDRPPFYTPPINQNPPHCSTCSCGTATTTSEIADSPSLSPVSDDRQLVTPVEVKEINFKDRPCIYDERQLAGCSNAIVEEVRESEREDRVPEKNFDERPIIFDEAQLSIGSSPILEDMPSPIGDNSASKGLEKPEYPKRNRLKKRALNSRDVEKPKRPKTLDLNGCKDEVFQIPVIYDERQFNLGSCSVTEATN